MQAAEDLGREVGVVIACQVLGVPRSGLYRERQSLVPGFTPERLPASKSPRALSEAERERLRVIREKVQKEFPPRVPPRLMPSNFGVGAQIRAAREGQGLSWYAVAKLAGIPNPSTVRDLEYGRDTKLSSVEAVAQALGLKLELVDV